MLSCDRTVITRRHQRRARLTKYTGTTADPLPLCGSDGKSAVNYKVRQLLSSTTCDDRVVNNRSLL